MHFIIEDMGEAYAVANALASHRFQQSCGCDWSVGWECDRCQRLLGDPNDDGETYNEFMQRYSDLIFNKRLVRSPEKTKETRAHLTTPQAQNTEDRTSGVA